MEKPGEPHAFSSPLPADPVHAVVPVPRAHQGQSVRPDHERAIESTGAMLEESPLLR